MKNTQWYRNRNKVLVNLEVTDNDNLSEDEVTRLYKEYLVDARQRVSIGSIRRYTGLSEYALYTDLKRLEVDSTPEGVVRTKYNFKLEPQKYLQQYFEYNEENGTLKRIAVGSIANVKKIGEVKDSDRFFFSTGITLSPRQIIWIMKEGYYPQGNICLHHKERGLRWENLYISGADSEKKMSLYTTRETVTVLGRDRVLTVDSSKPKQPKTSANNMRMMMAEDNCSGCNHDGLCALYNDCLSKDFKCDCRGFSKRVNTARSYRAPSANSYFGGMI